eukprot:12706-Heterococcus_DN1.PRE.5
MEKLDHNSVVMHERNHPLSTDDAADNGFAHMHSCWHLDLAQSESLCAHRHYNSHCLIKRAHACLVKQVVYNCYCYCCRSPKAATAVQC